MNIKITSLFGKIGTSDFNLAEGEHGLVWWKVLEKEITLPELIEGSIKGELVINTEDGKVWRRID